MKKTAVVVALLLGASIGAVPGADEPPVKKSTQGICHERGKGSYSQTKHFESYDTLEACIASGGRAATNAPVGKPEKSEWLAKYGGKLVSIVGVLAVAFGSYWMSARRRDRKDWGPKPPPS